MALAQTNPPAGEPPASDTATAGAAQSSAIVTLIRFDDVPLTTAIENLARQAKINYMLDPKVAFGQPGPDGKISPQPIITIRWENLTAEQALLAVLNNYGLQLVVDPKTKIARVTIKDLAAPAVLLTKIVQLKFANPSNILAAVQTVLMDRRSKVVPDVRTSQLVISATESELDAVDAMMVRLDTQTKQVLIEAKLIETTKNPTSSKGLDWSGTLLAQNLSFGNGVVQPANTTFQAPGTPLTRTDGAGRSYTVTPNYSSSTTIGSTSSSGGSGGSGGSSGGSSSSSSSTASSLTGGLIPNGFSMNTLSGLTPAMGFLNADGLHAVLSFLNSGNDAQILSTPSAVTLDNEEAVLSVSTALPVFATTAGTQGSPGGSQVSYTNVGTILHVTPRISANEFIDLKVNPEVSSQAGVATKTVAGVINQADIFDVRSIKTEVMIPSGNTLVLGGLVSDDQSKINTKVPIFGDLPILGMAFRSESKSQLKKNLLIFITPTIVKDTDFQPTKSEFLKSQPAVMLRGIKETSPWDGAQPYDWSKPAGAGHPVGSVNTNSLPSPKAL